MSFARIGRFVVVGTAAAAVHFGVVVALVSALGWPPLLANPCGWLVAFAVSYSGHRWLTFADHAAPVGRSALRFFVVSAAGFAVNEIAYATLLQAGGVEYRLALGCVLVGVAAATFIASRHWAFLGT